MIIKSKAFHQGDTIPDKHTGFGADISPELYIEGLCSNAVSLAVIMDDLDIPIRKELTHWIIWNIPAANVIPEAIPAGEKVGSLNNAVQGTAWGRHRYRGPKQPVFIRNTHRYRFTVYALDCFLNIGSDSNKSILIQAMNGHILEQGSLMGKYRRK